MENLWEFKTTIRSILRIESETEEELEQITNVQYCNKHIHKPLEYYCVKSKKIICVSCFVKSHRSHDCRDVTAVGEEIRKTIEKKARRSSNYADEMLLLENNAEMRKTDFLNKLVENETAITERNQELKDMIDRHTESVLGELSLIKSCHLREMDNKVEETDTQATAQY